MSTVQSVDRALAIIECLAREPKGLGITELSKELKLPKSTVHRLLLTLINRKFVVQDERNGLYALGMQFVSIASSILDSLDIREIARPELERLSLVTNEVIHLCILDVDEVIYIDKVEGDNTIRMHSKIGKRSMLHCTGVGKVLLAAMPEEEVESIAMKKGLPRFTERTLTTIDALKKELDVVRKQGYALDDIEHELGIRCVAAPIYNYQGAVVAAISISGPANRVTIDRIQENLLKEIQLSSAVISEKLGYQTSKKLLTDCKR
ncbi:IclR family transcriptional regulator [Halalkalibacterium ligniniphilum]|uniref:IclR family transcriptional regulator n=1 Tax=Halalkalibacterium ligniniphilum TaxID=1134413 RepID=UPI00034C55DF|nr:IclR family transcriptional regulator [Halalkalibacterium ligniniphilum]